MLVFVTGTRGFIGSHLARRLAHRGDTLRCLVRSTSNIGALKGLDASLVTADITDKDAIWEALDGVDIVYHNAAIVGEWISKKSASELNVRGTHNLL